MYAYTYKVYVGVRHIKFCSFGPNYLGGAARLHYIGYYTDRSYSVILMVTETDSFR